MGEVCVVGMAWRGAAAHALQRGGGGPTCGTRSGRLCVGVGGAVGKEGGWLESHTPKAARAVAGQGPAAGYPDCGWLARSQWLGQRLQLGNQGWVSSVGMGIQGWVSSVDKGIQHGYPTIDPACSAGPPCLRGATFFSPTRVGDGPTQLWCARALVAPD